eukprot:SAG22_NODE_7790_length_708_cov_1.261084_1_plen_167_part_10
MNLSAACRACDPGRFAASDGAPECTICAEGQPGWESPAGALLCTLCPEGKQDADESASTPCTMCEIGQYCPGGPNKPQICDNSTHPDDDHNPATPCSSNGDDDWCGFGNAYPLGPDGRPDLNMECEACATGTYSLGEADSVCEPCTAGQIDADLNPATVCVPCSQGT